MVLAQRQKNTSMEQNRKPGTDSMDTFEQTPEDSEVQESLEYCSLWGHKESDMTERMNKMYIYTHI